jgi:hypothetical protein
MKAGFTEITELCLQIRNLKSEIPNPKLALAGGRLSWVRIMAGKAIMRDSWTAGWF